MLHERLWNNKMHLWSPIDVLLAVLDVHPSVLVGVLEFLGEELSHFGVSIEHFAIVAEEERLWLRKHFGTVAQNIAFYLIQFHEQFAVLVDQKSESEQSYLQLGSSGSAVLRVKMTTGIMLGLLFLKNSDWVKRSSGLSFRKSEYFMRFVGRVAIFIITFTKYMIINSMYEKTNIWNQSTDFSVMTQSRGWSQSSHTGSSSILSA